MPKDGDATRFLDPAALSRVESMELRARLIVEGFITGLHRSPYHGFSVEFAEHRAYTPGDELRHVDWKVFAKTDRYYVKRYEEETNLRSYLVLDTSASMHYRRAEDLTKLEYGAYLAAGLAALMLRQRDAVGLLAFDETVHTALRPRATPGYLRRLLVQLDRLARSRDGSASEAPKRTSAAAALAEVAERIHRRSLVVLITDLFENVGQHDDLLKALRRLRHRGHEVVVFHVLEGATERQFAFPDAPMVFRDTETGAEIALQPHEVRQHYQEAVEHFSERFRRRCLQHDIDFAELDTGTPYDQALMTYLNKRRRLV